MDTAYVSSHDRSVERTQLWEYEHYRRDPRGRELYWSPQRWEELLDALIRREHTSDWRFRTEIADRRIGGDGQATLEQQLDSAIQNDIRWYDDVRADLELLRVQWEQQGAADTGEYSVLFEHLTRIEQRLRERQVTLQQVALEKLERRRLAWGHLGAADWHTYWLLLQQAFDDERDHYERTYGYALPSSIIQQRLEWLEELQAAQHTAAQLGSTSDTFDWQSYEAASATLASAVAAYRPAPPVAASDGAGAFIGVIVVIGLVAVLIFGVSPSRNVSSDDSPEPAAENMMSANSDANVAYEEGSALLRAGRCEEAIPAFDRAHHTDPGWYLPLNDKAFCLYDLGQVDKALSAWTLALERYPQSADAHAGLGMALYTMGNQEEGRRHYAQAVAINDGYRDPDWLKANRVWSDQAVTDSAPLREGLALPAGTPIPPKQ
jgi:tetratricopeptide (TPR) repeat protein